MNFDIQSLTPNQLIAFQRQCTQRINDIDTEIKSQHSKLFIDTIGIDILREIPVVDAKSVHLDDDSDYHQGCVRPSHLGDQNIVRGLDSANRPFIAIKVNLIDKKTDQIIVQLVEVVFKRYSIDQGGNNDCPNGGDNYVTALGNLPDGENAIVHTSGLYSAGGMTLEQYGMVKKLLQGEKVDHLIKDDWIMQLAE